MCMWAQDFAPWTLLLEQLLRNRSCCDDAKSILISRPVLLGTKKRGKWVPDLIPLDGWPVPVENRREMHRFGVKSGGNPLVRGLDRTIGKDLPDRYWPMGACEIWPYVVS